MVVEAVVNWTVATAFSVLGRMGVRWQAGRAVDVSMRGESYVYVYHRLNMVSQ
jgi:hypothetical protein